MKPKFIDKLDIKIISVMNKEGWLFLRYSLALVFIWFGVLKPLGVSPVQELVENTVYWVSSQWFVPFLGWWEVLIGVCLLIKPLIRIGILLLGIQIVGTFLPLIILPDIVYNGNVFLLTLEGQYIVKNLVLIGAALVIGSHVRD